MPIKNGPKHKLTYQRAAKIKMMAGELQLPQAQIKREVHCSQQTIERVMNDPVWQERLKDDKMFTEHRKTLKRNMQAQALVVANQALQQIEIALPYSSAPQAAIVFGILRDKERLDAGESTENISHVYKYDLKKLDKLAENLSKSLMPPGG